MTELSASTWPLTTERAPGSGALRIGGVDVNALAEEYGTPLWVVDEADLRARCRAYRGAFPDAAVAYASKAWCTVGILQIVSEEGLWVDVASGGELHTAEVAGVPMATVVFHGNNKSDAELTQAARLGVGRIVVDSFDEIDRLERIGAELGHRFDVWLRLTPGIEAHTHDYVRTGHDESKFGFSLGLGLADQALVKAQASQHVQVVGVHAHIGSQIFGTDPFTANAQVMVDVLARWRDEHGVELHELNLGGGMGVRYRPDDDPVEIERYGEAVLAAVAVACARHDLVPPRLAVEPGRAIIGPSAVTLYRVGTIKPLPGLRTYVSVDGGMSDNIRPALYGAEHEVVLAGRDATAPPEDVTIVGKHCESGDVLRERATLPDDLRVGDLLAMATTGAYTEPMASNYNRVPRPAAVLVRDGQVRPLIRRETYGDVVRRDVPLH